MKDSCFGLPRIVIWLLAMMALPPGIDCRTADQPPNEVEIRFQQAGLIDIHAIDPSIKVDLVNSDSSKNFFREDFYHGLNKAYLQKPVAEKLARAQKILKEKYPGYSLMIMDAARPRSVSRKMYDKMKNTPYEKYVADPKNGSMHNYGIAVDITIIDEHGDELDMGFSPFYKSPASLYLGFARHKMMGLGKKQQENRDLLKAVMKSAGFIPLSFEWWHFDGMPKRTARDRYSIIE